MSRQWLTGRAGWLVALAVVMLGYGFLVGCGGGGNYQTVGRSTGSTTTATAGALQLNLALEGGVRASAKSSSTYIVPGTVVSFRLTISDDAGTVLSSVVVPKATQVVLRDVPLTATNLLYELLDGNNVVVGTGRYQIVIKVGQTFVITMPPYDPVVTGAPALLRTTYYLTGTDTSNSNAGVFNGTLTFDGNGNVTGGQIVRKFSPAIGGPDQTFTVTGGTYAVAANRDFTASLTTDQYPLQMKGRVTMQPAGGAVYASLYGTGGGPGFSVSAFTTLQIASGSFSAASLNGTLMVAAFNPSALSGYFGYLTGSLVADGQGHFTGGSLLTVGGATVTVQGGTYTVAADGKVTGTIQTSGLGTLTVAGATGSDQVLSIAGVSDNGVDQLYLLGSPKPATVRTVNVPAAMRIVGTRSADGTLEGVAEFNAGSWTLTGGYYNDYTADFPPIVPSNASLPGGTFTVTESAELTGGTNQAASPYVTVGGVFTQSEVVFFSALKKGDGSPLAGNALMMVLVK